MCHQRVMGWGLRIIKIEGDDVSTVGGIVRTENLGV